MVRKLVRQFSEVVGAELRWIATKLGAAANRGGPGKRRRTRRLLGTSLSFNEEFKWAWMLRAYEGEQLLGEMQAASPLPLLVVAEEYVFRSGNPVPPYRAELVHARSGRRFAVDSSLVGSPDRPASVQERVERICAQDEELAEHVSRHLASSSVTVMVDERGDVVSSREVLGRVFGSGRQ